MKILLLNGTIVGNKSKVLLNEVEQMLEAFSSKYEVETLYLDRYEMELADGREKEAYNEDTVQVIEKMEEADGYIISTPIFQGSIPGALKNLFDLISPLAMRYKPVSIIANGGTFQHHLAVENQLKPILDYFRSLVTPNYVYTHQAHFSDKNELISEDVRGRLTEMIRLFDLYMEMSKEARKVERLTEWFDR